MSQKAEREFWDTHDAIEVFGERGWKVSEPGAPSVRSVYVAKVGAIGAKKGQKIKARVTGKRLVMELV
jgi:hypothetical protein